MEVEARLEGDHLAEGSWDLYEMIQAFLQAPSYHVFFEVLLIVWILRLIFFAKSYRSERTLLTEKEKDELIEEWSPEPLVPDTDEQDPALQNIVNRVIDGKLGKFMSINGRECLNLGTFNFLGMIGRAEIEEQAVKTMRQYGVGACGPRGFYGTLDVHLHLEEKLQEFMHCEEAIIYSYGFATIASIIPAYSKRGDVIFADEGVHFAVQQGITASRSRVRYFKHNDMEDLERVLEEQAREDKKNPKKAKVTRRFLVVEGLYMKYGDLCPLPKLVELKHKYKVRIFMDESISLGTLGKTGRGVTEYYNIDVNEIDLIAGSLENALGTIGGFCVGKSYVVDHQRLSGLGYCFSASAPPMLCQAAITALKILGESPELLTRLRDNAKYLHQKLAQIEGLKVSGESISPVIYVHLAEPSGDWAQDRQTLQTIVQQAEDHGIALTCASYLEHLEHCLPPPSIRVTVNCELTEDEMDSALKTITRVVKDCLPQV